MRRSFILKILWCVYINVHPLTHGASLLFQLIEPHQILNDHSYILTSFRYYGFMVNNIDTHLPTHIPAYIFPNYVG